MNGRPKNAWDEEVGPDHHEDVGWVAPEERETLDTDDSNALGRDSDGVDTGDDLDDWKPGDPL